MSAASAVGNELHYLAYYYGRFGNLDSQTMESNNGAMSVTESYSYDDLHRLTGSSLSSGGSISYSYDATGNLTQKSDYASSMTYGSSGKSNTGNAGPNAVLSATLVGGGSTSFSYDNNGNLISGAGKTISYNALNKPTQITAGGSTVNFAYDANWQRFKKTVSGNRTVYYIDDSVEVEQVDDTTITRTYIDDIAIVKRTKYAGLSLASHEITYTLRDRLGSVVTLTDHNNHILEHRSYDPFGKPRYGTMLPSSAATLFDVAGGTPFTLRGFTDHEHIDEAQLIHMNGRVYDYNLGRFLSIDPFVQAPGNSQSLNPYSYIMNNPLAGTDPSGYALVQGSIDCIESMAACATVLNGGTPTKNDFSGAAASNGSAPSSDGSDSDVEAEELGAPGEVGVSENHTLAITPKSDKIDADVLFEQLDYDPNGRSEFANAVLNPLDALEAKEAADDAVELTKEAFPNIRTAWNNVADAFRHATWNYLMTKKLGVDAAKEFGDAHERYSGNALGETTMDLYNNNVGRILGSNPDFKVEEAKRVILRAIRQGDLRTKPFEIIGGSENVETDY